MVLCGASIHAKNALGDTPVTLATRFGNTDLALLLNTSEQQLLGGGGGGAMMMMGGGNQ